MSAVIPPCKDSPDEMRHYWQWEPLEGQPPARSTAFDALGRKGRWLVSCGYGCGWTKEITLSGDERWEA